MLNISKYMLFYEHLYDYPGNTNNLMEVIGKNLSIIAKDCSIAKMDIEINLPPIFCERFPYTFQDTIFSTGEPVNLIPVTTDFTTSNDGVITIAAYSKKEVSWSREEVSEIIFLNEQIMVLITRSRLQSQIRKAEETDPITNTLNLAGIIHVGELLNIKKILPKFTVMNLNISNFKAYNDKYGHTNGDIILKAYASALSDFLEKDGVIGRSNADTFIIIAKTSRIESIKDFLKRCVLHIELDDMSKETIGFSTRIGICDGGVATYFPQLIVNASFALKHTSVEHPVEIFQKHTNI